MSAAPVILGVSGASGAAIALRLAELLSAAAVPVELIVTRGAEQTLDEEVGPDALARLDGLATRRHAIDDLGATVASGSYPVAGMIVAPCSMRSLGAIANSLSDNLLVRAADVQLKERRRLVLIARESPLHLGHLRAMCAVTEMGAIVAPPSPAFYLKPATLDEIIDQIARRAADLLGLLPPMARQWNGDRPR
ncbi:MAG TPA: UbiX family flavin prenyltransferase [Aurantimonas sp.]|uniref:Flavin prenyltransferase UbiX n=1 Tax=Aurantimonas marianensis TaxID=2920428 RepID=A0A9X2H6N3_9HYPH|nr:UbiX family flavin prenyltransferase [Aurantimonas marianensis]MCP3056302.1 UbiX family flavin prenyltransferase [Aurantimonas marianensis]